MHIHAHEQFYIMCGDKILQREKRLVGPDDNFSNKPLHGPVYVFLRGPFQN